MCLAMVNSTCAFSVCASAFAPNALILVCIDCVPETCRIFGLRSMKNVMKVVQTCVMLCVSGDDGVSL